MDDEHEVPIDAIALIAEVSIGLAGFASVAVALRRDPERWQPTDALRTQMLLLLAFTAFFGSLLAASLQWAGLSLSAAIRAGSALLLVSAIFGFASILRRRRRLDADQAAALASVGAIAGLLASVLNVAAQSIVVANVLPDASRGLFLYGLLANLGLAAFVLVRLLFIRPGSQ